MCGIAGLLAVEPATLPPEVTVARMIQRLYRRGPDFGATWWDAAEGIALGHRRLAIRDLSPTGNQPMVSSCERYVLVYNGELYNVAELVKSLGRRNMRGTSDTEVLLESIAETGVERTLRAAQGMFAFALWDRHARRLYLARDRMGEKPLYYGLVGGCWLFASELKAITAVAGSLELNPLAVVQFLKYGYVCEPATIYKGIMKLAPGTILSIDACSGASAVESSRYWHLWECVEAGLSEQIVDPDVAKAELDRVLSDVVRSQLAADVPVGCYLSGGIDSSLVAATMAEVAGSRIKTFTIGFGENDYDESEHARAIAHHLGTDHFAEVLSPARVRSQIELLPEVFDEPYADSSALPSLLLAQTARRHVTVCLSGDGGDELFCGYNRYAWSAALWRFTATFPLVGRAALSQLLERVSTTFQPGERTQLRMQKLSCFMKAADLCEAYDGLLAQFPDTWGEQVPPVRFEDVAVFADLDPLARLMAIDQLGYLVNDNLQKVDRASMHHSLETRIPLLHGAMVDLSWRIPIHMKLRRGDSKWLLKELLATKVPRDLFERPKRGFSVPIATWLRNELRSLGEDLLHALPEIEGVPTHESTHRWWNEHLSGTRNHAQKLWSLLVLSLWCNSSPQRASVRSDGTGLARVALAPTL